MSKNVTTLRNANSVFDYSVYELWIGTLAMAQILVTRINKECNKNLLLPSTEEEATTLCETKDVMQFLLDDGEATASRMKEVITRRKALAEIEPETEEDEKFRLFLEGITFSHMNALKDLKVKFDARFHVKSNA